MRRPKIRTVSFRLSEEEYQMLLSLSRTGGAITISEYARASLIHGRFEPNSSTREAWIATLCAEVRSHREKLEYVWKYFGFSEDFAGSTSSAP